MLFPDSLSPTRMLRSLLKRRYSSGNFLKFCSISRVIRGIFLFLYIPGRPRLTACFVLQRYLTQSSSTRPGTRSNSLTLFVTSIAPAAMACPAIAVSFGPIGVPARRSATLISVVASTAARSQGRIASRRAQHRLLQVLKHRFRLLAHDERADVRVEHIGLVHRLNRPSSLTMSSRFAIKSGSAFSSSRNELQVGRTGRRMMCHAA